MGEGDGSGRGAVQVEDERFDVHEQNDHAEFWELP